MSDLPPAAIVDEMQRLDDIEADLADTALAVAQDAPSTSSQGSPPQGSLEPGSESSRDLLQNAEAMEHVLEQAIPPPPAPSTANEQNDTSTPILPQSAQLDPTPAPEAAAQVNALPTPNPAPSDVAHQPSSGDQLHSAIADETMEALQAVQNDVNNPILPPDAVPSAQATPTEAHGGDSEEVSLQASLQTAPPADTASASVMANQNGDDVSMGSDPSALTSTTEVGQTEPAPEAVSVAVPSTAALPPRPDTADPVDDIKLDVDLPTGLTLRSPSIIANPDLFRHWAREPKNPNIILALFNWAVQKSEAADARIWYDLLAEGEPTAVQPLLSLINLELALSNFPNVEALFARALKGPSGGITAAADVSIWKAYLHYIRRQNPITEENAENVRGTITKAYEFALNECGTDRESGEIWQEYIAFVAEPTPKNAWDTQAQMDTLRRLYQRAVCIPLNNVEALWKAYDAFESGNNKSTAKKFLAEKSPAYMTARTALRELRTLTDSLPRPVLPTRPTFSEADRAMVNAWKNYLKWEEGNPLVIEDEEVRGQRIGYALRKCLGEMRHFPELWHYAANYFRSAGKAEQAAEVISAGVQACPTSMLLTFALADIEEDRRNLAKCHEAYEALIARLNPEIDDLKKKVEQEIETAKGPEIVQPQGGDVDMLGDELSEVQKLIEERENRGKLVAERRGKDVQDLATAVGVVWVMYMRFARRAEGTIAARNIFKKARQTPHPTWHIYEASAMMEYHANKDSAVAIRIFELGLKLFSEEVDYVTKYLQFLLSINDDTNARALFERSTVKIPAEKARPLWDTWARYEYMYGDLAGVQKLESRFAEVFPNDSPLKRFAQRFTYNGFDTIALRDLGFGVRHPPGSASQSTFLPPPAQATVSAPLPPQAIASVQQMPDPSTIKRPLPEDPRRESPSPSYKRPRAQSPQGRRFTPPQTDRIPSNPNNMPPKNFRDRTSRDRSPGPGYRRNDGPLPPPVPPAAIPRKGPGYGGYPAPSPPVQSHPPAGQYGPPGAYGANADRSGLPRALVQFLGSLPSARSFDGPMFKVHDIIDLFDNIARDGSGIRAPATAGYGPPGGGYGGPPPAPARGGYGDARGYGQPPRGRY